VFLHFAEYPPDPHRGMHIPAALVAYTLGDEYVHHHRRRHRFSIALFTFCLTTP
jgi:uncharacterized membrane protein YhhN